MAAITAYPYYISIYLYIVLLMKAALVETATLKLKRSLKQTQRPLIMVHPMEHASGE